jgi:hypothetical protein
VAAAETSCFARACSRLGSPSGADDEKHIGARSLLRTEKSAEFWSSDHLFQRKPMGRGMKTERMLSRLSIGALTFLLTFSVIDCEGGLAKVSLDSFSQAQLQWFWKQVQLYADMESAVEFCGKQSNFEQRMTAVARNCATDDAMRIVRAVFHSHVAGGLALYRNAVKAGRKVTLCTAPLPGSSELLVDSLVPTMDSAVNDVDHACRSCPNC